MGKNTGTVDPSEYKGLTVRSRGMAAEVTVLDNLELAGVVLRAGVKTLVFQDGALISVRQNDPIVLQIKS
jgi:hypothetical protein